MSITKKLKQEIISKFSRCNNDTGSTEIQLALFTQHINNLTEHLKFNRKDHQARRGLLVFVTKRKRLLLYLKSQCSDRYESIIIKLKLKRV